MRRTLGVSIVSCLLILALAGPALATWTVRVKGQGRAQITWGNISSSNQATRSLPWHHRVGTSGSFDVVSVLAQRQSDGPGRIVCQVIHNGNVVAHGRASGPYAICSATQST